MKLKRISIIVTLLLCWHLWGQSIDDASVVKAIIEKTGAQNITLENATVIENGRVVSLNLSNRDISKDGISFLPPEIGSLTELRELDISGNIIDSLPSEIGNLINLQKLNAGNNRIVELPSTIGKLTNLTHLDLRYNRLAQLPAELEQCKKLKILQLWGNKLVTIGDFITKMSSLEEIYLKDNRLTTLPVGITNMKLRYIDFMGNKICKPDAVLEAWLKKRDKNYKQAQKCW